MTLPKILSLRLRLTLLFLLLSGAAWLSASLVAWQQTRETLDELFDTQQMLFAKRLSALHLDEISQVQPLPTGKKVKRGHLDDDALAFAIFSPDGKRVLHDGENGEKIPWDYRRDGFEDGRLVDDKDAW